MEQFLEKFQAALTTLKPYIIGLIGLIALVQLFMSATVGGADRRQTIINILGLLLFASLIMYSDHIFGWIIQTFK